MATSRTKSPGKAASKAAGKTRRSAPRGKLPDELVHYYRLVFQVEPGGSRKAEFFVAGTIDEVRDAAVADLGSGDGAYHALFYGETIVLQCWEGTRKRASIDLHPFITYTIAGLAKPVRFKGKGDRPVFDMDDPELEDLMTSMVEEDVQLAVVIDWSRVKLPALTGRPLRKGELAPFDDPERPWPYGFTARWDLPIDDP